MIPARQNSMLAESKSTVKVIAILDFDNAKRTFD